MTNGKSKKKFLLVATIVIMLAALQLSEEMSIKYVLASVFYVNSGGTIKILFFLNLLDFIIKLFNYRYTLLQRKYIIRWMEQIRTKIL